MKDNKVAITPLLYPDSGVPEWWRRVADDTVVTRDESGAPLSRFVDNRWNLRGIDNEKRNERLNFGNLVPKNTTSAIKVATEIQAKQITYFLMHEVHDNIPAVTTLKEKVKYIRDLCRFAGANGFTLYEAIENTNVILSWINLNGRERASIRFHAVLVQLHRLGPEKIGVTVPLSELHGPMLKRYQQKPDYSQHSPLPSRIYSHLLSACEAEIALVERAVDDLAEQMERLYAGNSERESPSPELKALLIHFNKEELTARSTSGLITEIGLLCQTTILVFTGMRAGEGRTLPYDCLKIVRQDGLDHFSIQGITTKLNGGRSKRTNWITNHLGARAVKIAQKLFGFAHSRYGNSDYATSSDGTHMLFCRTGLYNHPYLVGGNMGDGEEYWKAFKSRCVPQILAEDMAELKRIDPFRAWDDEPEFAVGETWPLTRHQLRRSLALYAQRSGLVSLPSLKRQLQHITLEMAMYYARGSAYARDILSADPDHFAKEWQDTGGLSQYLAFDAVLFGDDRLHGGLADFARSRAVKQSPVSIHKREVTLRKFERGQMAYQETVLGGCGAVGPCEASPLDWLNLKCLKENCKNLVVEESKLKIVVKAQQKLVERLDNLAPGSVEHRMEKDTLATLLDVQAKIEAAPGVSND